MTVPRLQGWWDELSPYISKDFLGRLEERIYPNRKLQREMQQEVARNPQLLQYFADLNSRDSELLNKMGLPNIKGIIGGLPESAGSIEEKEKRQYLQSPLNPKEKNQRRANTLGIRDEIEQEGKELDIEGKRTSNKLSDLELLTKEIFKPILGKEVAARGANLDEQLRQFGEGAKGIEARNKLKDNYENKSQLSPEELNILSTNPRFKEEFERIRDDYWNREREKFSIRMSASERRSNQEFSLMARWAEQIADYGGTDPMSVIRFTTLTPDEQDRIRKSTAPASAEEEPFWRAGQGMNNLKDKHDVTLQRNIVDTFYKDASFNTGIKTLQSPKSTKAQKEAAANIINGVFAAKGKELGIANPPQIKVEEVDNTWPRRNTFEITLSSGDLSLADAVARAGNITINTPAITEQRKQMLKLTPEQLDGAAQELAKDLAILKTQKEKDDFIAKLSSQYPTEIVVELRKRLAKFSR
jgi:hypothetical protein